MKIATWNINSIKSRLQHVVDWSVKNEPDVLCLQETKVPDDKFPLAQLRRAGFEHFAFHGERAYNGVAICSRHPLDEVQKNLPDDREDAQARLVYAMVSGVHVVNVYVPHGTLLGSEKYDFKLNWLRRLRTYLDANFDEAEDVVLCGDLNIAPHDMDVWKMQVWRNKLHVTPAEREALAEVKRWGFVDVYRHINPDAREYSWWDYFHEHSVSWNKGLRLDHIWASPPLAEACTDCWIDKEPRVLEKPSDHAPVVAEFAI